VTPTPAEILIGIFLSAGFLAILAVAELWTRRGRAKPEWSRKLVHCAGGILALLIPMYIESHWVVLAMSIGLLVLFLVGRYCGNLPSLYSVRSDSWGVEYFPIVVYLLFILSTGRTWMYVICILVLGISDTLAALVGSRFGKHRYQVDSDYKSIEGSLVCFLATFTVVVGPLFFWPHDDFPTPIIRLGAAVITAILVATFEAIALRGRDNLWLPLGTFLLLSKLLRCDEYEILVQLGGLITIVMLVGFAGWISHATNVGATLIVMLMTYAAYSLGSIDWALPILICIAFYLVIQHRYGQGERFRSHRMTQELLLPFSMLAVANWGWSTGRPELYAACFGPFLVANLTLVTLGAARLTERGQAPNPQRSLKNLGVIILLGSVIVLTTSWLLQTGISITTPLSLFGVVLTAGIVFHFVVSRSSDSLVARPTQGIRRTIACGAVLIYAVLQAMNFIPSWNAH
jgi:dolichol kinase